MLLQGELTGGEPGERESGEVADPRQGAVVRSFALVAFEGTPERREPGFLDPFFVGVSGVEAGEDEDVSGSGGGHVAEAFSLGSLDGEFLGLHLGELAGHELVETEEAELGVWVLTEMVRSRLKCDQ